MKILLFLFLSIFSFADISKIIKDINKAENFKYNFKRFISYNIFLKEKIETKHKRIISNKAVIKFKLDAILGDKALINNRLVKVGDIINGFKVIRITPNRVILKNASIIKVLKFKTQILKAY